VTTPAYPSQIFTWTDRQDETSLVEAADPNSIAADLVAVETTLGTMPQLESNPVAGPQINFTNVNQRLDYLTSGSHLPVCQLGSSGQQIASGQGAATNYGQYNSYGTVVYDPFGLYNGSDVTIPVTGWYSVEVAQFWPWAAAGYGALHLWTGSIWADTSKWSWDFPENVQHGAWQGGSNIARPGPTRAHFEGVLNQGTRIRAISENGTAATPVTVTNMRMSVSLARVTPPDPKILPVPVPVGTTAVPPVLVTRYHAPPSLSGVHTGNGEIQVTWGLVTGVTPAPTSYTVAVYYTYYGGLAFLTLVSVPAGPGTQELTVTGLAPGNSYQVHVWANGGLVEPPHATVNISI
jgi:hypothetical protein